MSLADRILMDLKQAMREGDKTTREVLRMIKAELVNLQIELGKDLTEADEVAVLRRAVKSRAEVAEQYEAAGRQDAADAERREIDVVERYLPAQMSEEQVRDTVRELVAELGLSSKKDMGRLMKELVARHGTAVDGRLASRIAAELLG